MGFLFIALTILFTVYGQLVIKWRVDLITLKIGELSLNLDVILKLVLDPFIISGFASAFIASLCWMFALSKFDLSFAYPFMGLNFVLVFTISVYIFNEPINIYKLIGLSLIVLGIVVTALTLR